MENLFTPWMLDFYLFIYILFQTPLNLYFVYFAIFSSGLCWFFDFIYIQNVAFWSDDSSLSTLPLAHLLFQKPELTSKVIHGQHHPSCHPVLALLLLAIQAGILPKPCHFSNNHFWCSHYSLHMGAGYSQTSHCCLSNPSLKLFFITVPAENVYPSATGVLPTVRSIVSAHTASVLPNISLPVCINQLPFESKCFPCIRTKGLK